MNFGKKRNIPVADESAGSEQLAHEAEHEHVEQVEVDGVNSAAEKSQLSPDSELADRLKREAEESYDKYVRSLAELENFKKRALKERAELLKYAGENILRDMLDIVDDLERALKVEIDGAGSELKKGVQMVVNRFQSVLEKHSVKRDNSVGQTFDPAKHEAMTMVPTKDHASGTVIEEFRPAYYFKDRMLRPAQVVVAKSLEDDQKN